jgi:competence protein CoiA
MYVAEYQNKLIEAPYAKKGQTFYCPSCHQIVFLKHGTVVMPHFAHQKDGECVSFSENESIKHLKTKLLLRDSLSKKFQVEIEKVLPQIKQRADLMVSDGNRQLAIEFQLSPISVAKLRQRNSGYQRIGIPVIWILGQTYKAQLSNPKVVNKFVDQFENIYFFDEEKHDIQTLSHFEKKDFRPLKFQKTSHSIDQIFDLQKQQSTKQTLIFDPITHLMKMESHLIKGFVNKELVAEIYQTFQKPVTFAPDFIHFGSDFRLSVPNFEFRLWILFYLKKNPNFSERELKEFLIAKKQFAQNATKSDGSRKIIEETLNELKLQKSIDWYPDFQSKLNHFKKIY